MVYRESALHAPEIRDDDPDRALITLDVSGARGRDGPHGQHGAAGYSGGGDGGDGGDAGPAQMGQRGGLIDATLAPHPSSPEIELVVQADVTRAHGPRQTFERAVRFDDGGFLDLLARGGRGGDGGWGGDGGPGGRGSAGRDATRHRRGGDGGPGGDGGDGGDGSSGAAGGGGGRIDVHVSAEDTHLLMLIRRDARGGEGGAPGVNGHGGAAGTGGPGGSSHSWTTTESYTDSNGKRRTRTRWHRNPGGSRGPSGSRGRDARAALYPGARGQDGAYTIHVHGPAGTARYADRYRLQLVGFAHVSANQDGVYEPGERVEVTGLTVRNVGGMPTPPNHDVQLALESEGWVWPDRDAHLVLPHALPAGAAATVPGSLFFEIGPHEPEGASDPLHEVDHILHAATLPAAHREFEGYHAPDDPKGRFEIRYPLEASVLESLHGLAPGQASRIRFAIRSVSRRDFGASSELARAVRFRLAPVGSELGADHVTLLDADDRPVPFEEGWVLALPRVGAGSQALFEGTVAIAPGAPHYRSATFRLSLELGPPKEPGAPRPIQYRDFTFRVARRYRRVEGCDLLLVTSHRCTRAQLEAWERLAERLGLRMAVWDVSLEGHLDLTAERVDGSLADHVSGGTIVLLNPEIETPAGRVRAEELLDRDALRELRRREASLAIFGGDDPGLERWLLPDDDLEPQAVRESPKAFREALAGLADLHGQGELEVHETVEVHHIGFFFEPPTEELLTARAERLARHLGAEYPNRRFVVTTRFDASVVSSLGLAKRWKVGTLEVRTTLESGRSHVVHVGGLLGEARPIDVDGPYGDQVVLLACDFDRKLDRLQRALDAGRDAWPEVRAILVDLVNEQDAIRRTGWRRGLSGADMERALPLLRALSERALRAPDPDDRLAVPLLELAARVRFHASAQVRWWEHPLAPLRRAPRLAWVTARLVDAWIERTFALPSTEDEAREEASEARVEEAKDKVALRVSAHEGGLFDRAREEHGIADRREYARRLMRAPIEWEGVTTDAELLRRPEDRVVGPLRLAELRSADEAADAVRRQVRVAQRDARARLLRHVRVEGAEVEPAEVEVEATQGSAAAAGPSDPAL